MPMLNNSPPRSRGAEVSGALGRRRGAPRCLPGCGGACGRRRRRRGAAWRGGGGRGPARWGGRKAAGLVGAVDAGEERRGGDEELVAAQDAVLEARRHAGEHGEVCFDDELVIEVGGPLVGEARLDDGHVEAAAREVPIIRVPLAQV